MLKGDPLDFLVTPSTPLKRIRPKPQGPPPPWFPTTVHLRMHERKMSEPFKTAYVSDPKEVYVTKNGIRQINAIRQVNAIKHIYDV
jgi:hypothetical protein